MGYIILVADNIILVADNIILIHLVADNIIFVADKESHFDKGLKYHVR